MCNNAVDLGQRKLLKVLREYTTGLFVCRKIKIPVLKVEGGKCPSCPLAHPPLFQTFVLLL